MTPLLRPVLLLLLLAGCSQMPSLPWATQTPWQTGEYRDASVGPVRSPASTGGPLKLEQTEVIRPKLAPGERALLVARYSVSAAAPIDVRETRVIRYGERVLLTRESVVNRARGEWRSEYPLPVPADATEGAYTLTTRIEPVTMTTRGPAEEQVKMFTVERGKSSPPAAGASSAPNVRIRLWTDKQRYKIGEKVTFNFETTTDGYVTLVNAATSGSCNVLFPNPYSDGNAVKAKTRYSVPRPQDTYSLTVGGPSGIDLVYAVLTVEPMKLVEGDTSRACDLRPLTRSINVVVNRTAPEKQDRATLEIEVVP